MSDFHFVCEHLTVGYAGEPLISEINFHLPRGSILCLIGPNGAGKTTILRSLIRQLPPLTGTAYLNGRDLYAIPPRELARELSLVLTQPVQTELMNCFEVVATGRHPYTGRFGQLSQKDREKVIASLREVDIVELAGRDFRHCSDGEKQRVMLARALCQEASVMILDEPTSHLDVRYKLEFLTTLQKLSRQGITVIMSLHELDFAMRVADLIASVKGDKIDRIGPPAEIFQGRYPAELYELRSGQILSSEASPELPRPEGPPRHFVLAGAGEATVVMRALQRAERPFACGFLQTHEADYATARALAQETIATQPYDCPGEIECQAALGLLEEVETIVLTQPVEKLQTLGDAWLKVIEAGRARGKAFATREDILRYGL